MQFPSWAGYLSWLFHSASPRLPANNSGGQCSVIRNLADQKWQTMTEWQWLTESLSVTHKQGRVQTDSDPQSVTQIQEDRHSDGHTDCRAGRGWGWEVGGGNGETDQDFVLPGEVGWFTEQLCVRDSEGTGSISNQHCVIQPGSTWCRWHQVTSLKHSRIMSMC